jgi:signal transduction histidine kinase
VDIDRSTAEGGLGRVLADVLHDPGLRLGYPVGAGGSIVDAEGLPLVADPERRVTQLVTEDGVLAVVESNVVSIEALERELSPTAHLALGNERLRAEALARLADVTASRARIVETADAVRRRMERDLHDGAQQRLLALTYDLRVALTIAEASGHEHAAAPLRSALDQAVAAAQELREVAHGIFPAELGAAGLEAALESLADLRPLRLTIDLAPGRRYRSEVENAVYAVLAEAGDEGSELDVALHESDSVLRVTVAGDIEWGERLVRLEDRIGAAGGSVRVASGQLTATLPV